MRENVLLLTPSDELARRIQQLLSAGAADYTVEWRPLLTSETIQEKCSLVLLDEALSLSEDTDGAPGEQLLEAWRNQPLAPAFVLLAGSSAAAPDRFRRGIVDCVHKGRDLGKLPFIVQEQLIAARLRRSRRRYETAESPEWPAGFSLRHEINNPLAGILGNAELALASKNRLPADVRERLERIVQLAVHLREILNTPRSSLSHSEPPHLPSTK